MIRSISFVLITTLAVLFSISVLRSQEPQGQTLQQGPEMDEKQLKHSKLYHGYTGIGDLRSIAANSGGDVEVLNGVAQKIFSSSAPSKRSEDFIADIARQADTIIIGTVNNQQSFLTVEGTFVFTDYTITVQQILKNNAAAELRPSDSTIVTRPGGTVQLSRHTVRASDESLAPFEVGKRYLLFLKYIPATDAYRAFEGGGAFRIDLGKTAKLTKEQLPNELERGTDLSALIASIQATLH
jgi:hypothetical protein